MRERVFKFIAQRTVLKTLKFLEDPIGASEEKLLSIIRKNSNTIFGKHNNFSKIKSVEDFHETVPLHTHKTMDTYLELLYEYPQAKILTSAPIFWYALSSGTTGEPKALPITKDGIKDTQSVMSLPIMGHVVNQDVSDFLGPILMFGSSPWLRGERNGIPMGAMSGISRIVARGTYKGLLHPPLDYYEIKDNAEKAWKYMVLAVKLDIRGMGGMPNSILIWLRSFQRNAHRLLEHFNGTTEGQRLRDAIDDSGHLDISELWPKFQLIIGAGVNMAPYKEWMSGAFPNILLYETYNAAEGAFGAKISAGDDIYLMPHVNYYEFIPIEEAHKPNPSVVPLSDVKVGKRYELVITNLFGWTRLRMKDFVTFSSVRPYKITDIGRVTRETNLAGENLNDMAVLHAVTEMTHETGAWLVDFSVVAMNSVDRTGYTFIGVVDNDVSPEEIQLQLDVALCKESQGYRVALERGDLAPIEVRLIENPLFVELNKYRLQMKPPILTSEEFIFGLAKVPISMTLPFKDKSEII